VALGTSNTDLGRKQTRAGLDRVQIANGGRQVEVFQTGKEYYTGHADEDPYISRGVVHTLGVRSLYAVPLRVNSAIRGILVAESTQPDRFSQAERDFFEAASRWVGIVAHRAELHEELTKRAADETRRMVAEEMLTTVAHDLRDQITPIRGRLDLLLRRLRQEHDGRDAADIQRVSASVDRLNSMVTDLLDVARLEGGIFSLSRRPADLVDLVHGAVEVARGSRPEIEVRAPQELVADVDGARVAQALRNLVSNAVQHTPSGVSITVSVGPEQRDGGTWALMQVHDEGPGIAPDLLPHLFARHVAGRGGAGLGIGLYLARGIAVAHGGDLTVQSEPGQGTTFTLALPMAEG
jgi:signal transduction histidine kinase